MMGFQTDKLSLMFVLNILFCLTHITTLHSSSISQCFSEADTLKWNRSLNFNNRLLVLKLAVSDDPAHWIINYLFELLARERLGYKNIEFVRQPLAHNVRDAIADLMCTDRSCTQLPNAHLNLFLWIPVGMDVGQEPSAKFVTNLGPLGPTRPWGLTTQSEFNKKRHEATGSYSSCEQNSLDFPTLMSLIHEDISRARLDTSSKSRRQPVTVHEFHQNDTTLITQSFLWADPPLCGSTQSDSTIAPPERHLCRTEAYQAVKLSWADLSTASPPLSRLASRMQLTTDEFAELLRQVRQSINALNASQNAAVDPNLLHTVYRENACRWLRRNPAKWKNWTEGWDQKTYLTVAGMFTTNEKYNLTGLQDAAEVAIRFVNEDRDYLRHSEYALKLEVYNLSCKPGTVLSEYFKILASARESRLIGSLAAVCSDSMEAMVELANRRKKLIISPTLATARFLEQQHFPHFFRTVPAMTEANFVLLRLFLNWGWHRVAVFHKRDHFFTRMIFQINKIKIIAEIEEEESEMTYPKSLNSLFNLKQRNSRIFIIEHDARGTYLILCAAYHLGMHSRAGYVWFLNPWLSSNWWTQPALASLHDCTYDEMANITSWTFTVGHQWLIPQMLHSFTWLSIPEPNQSSSTSTSTDPEEGTRVNRVRREYTDYDDHASSSSTTPKPVQPAPTVGYDPTVFYLAYTTDAVMTLASALVNLLKENPSAISALDRPSVAETFRHWIARTEFGYGIGAGVKDFFPDFGFQAAGEFYGVHQNSTGGAPRLRFNALNERIADHWLLKQHLTNTTVPIFVWSARDRNSASRETGESVQPGPGDSDNIMADFVRFERQMNFLSLDKVTWTSPKGPPDDGSIDPDKNCAFPFLSQTLRMGCPGATVFVAIMLVVALLIPIIVIVLHYRRKLREAEKRTRKPFEELCTELADLDMPVETIVLNRRIGQGAFGLVYGGEAKNNGCWEAVAVKVIDEKATYEGKIDFLSEAKLMRSLKHRNVVRLIGISLGQKENLYLVMELMLLGDLKTYLLSRRILAQRSPDHDDIRPSTLTQMSIDIAQGLSYLHSKQLIHRDIACRNCLVGSDHVVKIGDFGLTREASKNKPECYYRFTRNCQLPIRWMSPEAMQYGTFGVQSDIWSYGITLYEIVTFGVFPYSEMGDVDVVERVKRMEISIVDFLPASARNTIVWQLIKRCCQYQLKNRPASMHEVLQILYNYPDCVRPFLTDDPPKPIATAEQQPFLQPFVGTCVLSDTTTTPFDCGHFGGDGLDIMAQHPLTYQLPVAMSAKPDFNHETHRRFDNLADPVWSDMLRHVVPYSPASQSDRPTASTNQALIDPTTDGPRLRNASLGSLDGPGLPNQVTFHLHDDELSPLLRGADFTDWKTSRVSPRSVPNLNVIVPRCDASSDALLSPQLGSVPDIR